MLRKSALLDNGVFSMNVKFLAFRIPGASDLLLLLVLCTNLVRVGWFQTWDRPLGRPANVEMIGFIRQKTES